RVLRGAGEDRAGGSLELGDAGRFADGAGAIRTGREGVSEDARAAAESSQLQSHGLLPVRDGRRGCGDRDDDTGGAGWGRGAGKYSVVPGGTGEHVLQGRPAGGGGG